MKILWVSNMCEYWFLLKDCSAVHDFSQRLINNSNNNNDEVNKSMSAMKKFIKGDKFSAGRKWKLKNSRYIHSVIGDQYSVFLSLFNHRPCNNWGSKWGKTPLYIKTNNSTKPLLRYTQSGCSLWALICLFQQAPCRKLLTTLIKHLEEHLFDPQDDIYMPNCDKRGFFRKKQVSVQTRLIIEKPKCSQRLCNCICQNSSDLSVLLMQCWSSRGKQRGKCWCVDQNGMMVSSNAKQKGSLSC